LRKHIETSNREQSPSPIWADAQKALIGGDAFTLERLLRENEQLFREQRPPSYGPGGLCPDYSGGDARSIIARNHHFENWTQFEEYFEAVKRKNAPVAQFERAVDAIVTGRIAMLRRLLRDNPELLRARSMRLHRATLLHYVGANGVEYFRQRTPKNIVRVAEVLIEAGAEVDAEADMYGGGSKTLGMAATSIHPYVAGVLEPLIALLLKNGASVDDPRGGSIVRACLANGRPRGAELMAERGARLDLEGAAGIGQIELVKAFFHEDGALKPNATETQMRDGFAWACEYGRTAVVEFLLDRGMEIDAKLKHHGQTGLHWAAYNAHTDTVKLLLTRQAAVDAKDETWGTTPLGWAIHAWCERPRPEVRGRFYDVAGVLVGAGASVRPEWLAEETIRGDDRMLAALQEPG
jgi:hypothetical protein